MRSPNQEAGQFSRSEKRLLLLIIIFGFLLRVSTIFWGAGILPYTGRYHPDEKKTFQHAVEFPSNYGSDTGFTHGSTVPYLLATLLLPVKSIVTPAHWEIVCLMGMRAISVLAGTAALLLVYWLALDLYDRNTALLAAAITAVSFTHCMNSAFATQDIIVGFFLLTCFLALFRAVRSGRDRDFLILGVLTGLLLGTKITAALFLFAIVVLAVIDIVRAHGAAAKTTRRWIVRLAICGEIAFVVFAVTSPHIVLNFSGFLAFWKQEKFLWYDRGMVPWNQVPGIWWRITAMTVTVPVLIAFFVGVLLPGRRNRFHHLAILGFIVLYYWFLRHHVLPRYIATLAPLMCIYAAHACMALVKRPSLLLRMTGLGFAAIILVVSGWACGQGIHARFADPRTEASKWLNAHIQPGSTVALAGDSPPIILGWEYPWVDESKLKMVSPLEQPDVIIMSSLSYGIMEQALRSPYLKNWSWDPNHNNNWYNYDPPSPETFMLFDELIRGSGKYYLEADFPLPDTRFQVDFMTGIRIYRRTSF